MAATDSNAPASLPSATKESAAAWFASWTFIILGLVLLARTDWGKPIVYYTTWLAIAVLVLGHSQAVVGIITGQGNSY